MKQVIFIGNRFGVLNEIRKSSEFTINQIYAVKGSFLEKELSKLQISHQSISSKQELIGDIMNSEFDVLVSNGCPYILPVSKLRKDEHTYVNIHPSLLPDLRGRNPINGALLYHRQAGASCHLMDDGIDTGEIIAQVEIDLTPDVDLGLLYRLSFLAEADAFRIAAENGFSPRKKNSAKSAIYYSRKHTDLIIDFKEDVAQLLRRIRAFGLQSQGAYFVFKGHPFIVLDAEIVTNYFLLSKINHYSNYEIVFIYENNLILRKDETFIKLKNIRGSIEMLNEGDKLI